MITLPDAIVPILAPFATLFTNPTWRKAQLLMVGAILATGQRTVPRSASWAAATRTTTQRVPLATSFGLQLAAHPVPGRESFAWILLGQFRCSPYKDRTTSGRDAGTSWARQMVMLLRRLTPLSTERPRLPCSPCPMPENTATRLMSAGPAPQCPGTTARPAPCSPSRPPSGTAPASRPSSFAGY